jgi:hypothetical protein
VAYSIKRVEDHIFEIWHFLHLFFGVCGKLFFCGAGIRRRNDVPIQREQRTFALLAVPGVEMPTLGSEWPMLRQLCIAKKLAANDIPDAWLAAAVIRLGEHLVTFDTDFKKLLSRTQVTVLIPG